MNEVSMWLHALQDKTMGSRVNLTLSVQMTYIFYLRMKLADKKKVNKEYFMHFLTVKSLI